MSDARAALLGVYDHIKENLYLCYSDVMIERKKFNSNLLFGLITCVLGGKQLLMGEYGGGKTTSSEYLLSFMHAVPKRVLVASTLKGNSELTLEKVTGRPNLGLLNQGIEKVVWSLFVSLEPKIIDEFNRIPESKQNLLLEGLDRGNWQYLNETIVAGNAALFATVNYKDSGNTRMVEAALDRFDIAVESRHPGVNNMRILRQDDRLVDVDDADIEKQFFEVLLSDALYDSKRERLRPLQDKYRSVLSARTGISIPEESVIEQARVGMQAAQLDARADLFMDLAISEMSSCVIFGQKRSNERCIEGCHYQNLLCGKKQSSDSVRTMHSQLKYAKALAWLVGSEQVSVDHLSTVMPYTLWHKIRFSSDWMAQLADNPRQDPLQLYASKLMVEDLLKRFERSEQGQREMYALMRQGKISAAKSLAKELDHPVFDEYLRLE